MADRLLLNSTSLSSIGLGRNRLKIVGRHTMNFDQGGGASDVSATGRQSHVLAGAITRLQALFFPSNPGPGADGASGLASVINQVAFENGNAVTYATKSGSRDIAVPNTPAIVSTDAVGFPAPAGSTIYARTFRRVPQLATGLAAAAITGGILTASTTYFYKLTTVDNGFESGPTAEVSATTGASGTLGIRLTWTVPAFGQFVNVYQSTATGAEKFLAQVPIAQTSYADLGYSVPNTAVSPPAASLIYFERALLAGDSANTPSGGGNGANVAGVTGAIAGAAGPSGAFFPAPSLLLGDDWRNPSVIWMGDSIGYGTGIYKFQAGPYSVPRANMFDAAVSDGQFAGTLNMAVPSGRLDSLLNGLQSGVYRLALLSHADYVIDQFGINDITNGATWQQLAANKLILATNVANNGGRYLTTTLTPNTTSTNSFTTVGGQTVAATESQRLSFNSWVRGGSLVDGSGNPVLTGGTPSKLVFGSIDVAAAIEVTGGLWAVPSGTVYSAQTLTGTPTVTSLPVSTAAYPTSSGTSPGLVGKTIVMTSGAAAGQTAVVSGNTGTTLTLYANGNAGLTGKAIVGLTTAPAAGDTFNVVAANTSDGLHPSPDAYAIMSANAVAPALAAKIVRFGAMGT